MYSKPMVVFQSYLASMLVDIFCSSWSGNGFGQMNMSLHRLGTYNHWVVFFQFLN